jgi:hypothetical protein
MEGVLPAITQAAAAKSKALLKPVETGQEGVSSPLKSPTAALDVLHLLLGRCSLAVSWVVLQLGCVLYYSAVL